MLERHVAAYRRMLTKIVCNLFQMRPNDLKLFLNNLFLCNGEEDR